MRKFFDSIRKNNGMEFLIRDLHNRMENKPSETISETKKEDCEVTPWFIYETIHNNIKIGFNLVWDSCIY